MAFKSIYKVSKVRREYSKTFKEPQRSRQNAGTVLPPLGRTPGEKKSV